MVWSKNESRMGCRRMMDRGKVIKGLHCCANTDGMNCTYCPYGNADEDCTALMSMDVLDLLKEQKEKNEKILAALDGYRMCDEMSKNAYDNLTKLVKSEIGEGE